MKKHYLTLLTGILLLLTSTAYSLPKLNSYPSATATLFLDFDGHTVVGTVWNGGNAMYCEAAPLTEAQIVEIFNRVSEDFRPFNLNITTDSSVYLSTPLNRRNRIIITPTSAWAPGVGGLAYINSFSALDDIPAFVFSDRLGPNSGKMIAECCSHESGHTLGLQHQSKYDATNCDYPVQEYYNGVGTGEAAWSPIMGNSYYRNMTNWNNGQIQTGCTNTEDNLQIITTQNGFTYRTDDYAENMNGSTTAFANGNFTVDGIITTNTDIDAFKFTLTNNSNVHVTAIPYNLAANYVGANLDIKLQLFNASGTLIRTYDPVASMSITVDTVLNLGTYYWRVDGAGNVNVGEYGSLGSYTLSSTSSALPIKDIALTGLVEKGKHSLSWKIIADEPIESVVVEASQNNGLSFSALSNVPSTGNKFIYTPYQTNTIYYRLKVTSVIHQVAYSNTVALKSIENTDAAFNVSTFVQNEIRVNAAENYQYRVVDMNGRQVANGNGVKGISTVNISKEAKGMYIIQLFTNTKIQSERIIKN
ncbi:MAG: T9SS type A sorting domain-containing protein [Chitinophagaceae bacterium]|nr:T9SS type A sorting domain-containing protein [Chitinophagaceae bacterium]